MQAIASVRAFGIAEAHRGASGRGRASGGVASACPASPLTGSVAVVAWWWSASPATHTVRPSPSLRRCHTATARALEDLDRVERQLEWLSPEVGARDNQLGLAVLGAACRHHVHTHFPPDFIYIGCESAEQTLVQTRRPP